MGKAFLSKVIYLFLFYILIVERAKNDSNVNWMSFMLSTILN